MKSLKASEGSCLDSAPHAFTPLAKTKNKDRKFVRLLTVAPDTLKVPQAAAAYANPYRREPNSATKIFRDRLWHSSLNTNSYCNHSRGSRARRNKRSKQSAVAEHAQSGGGAKSLSNKSEKSDSEDDE